MQVNNSMHKLHIYHVSTIMLKILIHTHTHIYRSSWEQHQSALPNFISEKPHELTFYLYKKVASDSLEKQLDGNSKDN